MHVDPSHPLPLRAIYPNLHDAFTALLEQEHLHIYDTRLLVKKEAADHVTVLIQYGNHFRSQTEQTFKESELEQNSDLVLTFVRQVVAKCKDAVEEDYRVFMKVEP